MIYGSAVAITPHDTNDQGLGEGTDALHIGVSGTLSVVMKNGSIVSFGTVPVGTITIKVTRVRATGTTATSITGLWARDP